MKVRIITTFVKEVDIEASSELEAKRKAFEAIGNGEINGLDTDEFETEVEVSK